MDIIDAFVYFIFLIKIVFIILVIIGRIVVHKKNEALYEKIMEWKDKFEHIFLFCVSILCLYVFFPRKKVVLNFEMQFLFFVYGIVVLIELFINSSFNKTNIKK
jgi:uncharacterized membrane protein YgdD (TMEM256/DUF423 family)